MAPLRVSTQDRVTTITLADAGARNAFSTALGESLLTCLDDVRSDDGVRAVILDAEGPAFCVGGNVTDFADLVEQGTLVDKLLADMAIFNAAILSLAELPCPTVAVLHGAVAGGGLALAAACDMRICTPDAFFVPGFIGIALPPDTGSSWLLTRLMGEARAFQFLARNMRLDAATAHAWNLVDEVRDDPGARALELGAEFAMGPPEALAATKVLVRSAHQRDFAGQLAAEGVFVARAVQGPDFAEGVLAFAAKRRPTFGIGEPVQR